MSESSYNPLVYREQGGAKMVVKAGGAIWDKQARGDNEPSIVFEHQVTLEQATALVAAVVTPPDGMEIIDVFAEKTGGGSGTTVSTVQVLSSSGGAISNALNIKVVDNTVVRAGTLNRALRNIPKGGSYQVARAGSVGSTAAGANIGVIVHVLGVKRST